MGGDKGGNSFKMNFQIVNTPTPNSVQNTCVFSIFEADDSATNLHVALDRYKPQIESLQGMKWRLATFQQLIFITLIDLLTIENIQCVFLFVVTMSS